LVRQSVRLCAKPYVANGCPTLNRAALWDSYLLSLHDGPTRTLVLPL
jgi:hypothetical protein